jgi:hypothetical protein
MKFLCVPCDEAMRMTNSGAPGDGSMTVVFKCPSCGRETAMLTNAMETQMVRSLGVKIGGRSTAAEPMELVRASLAGATQSSAPTGDTDETGSKCPFSGVVADALSRAEGAPDLVWTAEAEARIERIPFFAREMARKGVERHARENGHVKIDNAVIDEVKDRFGM